MRWHHIEVDAIAAPLTDMRRSLWIVLIMHMDVVAFTKTLHWCLSRFKHTHNGYTTLYFPLVKHYYNGNDITSETIRNQPFPSLEFVRPWSRLLRTLHQYVNDFTITILQQDIKAWNLDRAPHRVIRNAENGMPHAAKQSNRWIPCVTVYTENRRVD